MTYAICARCGELERHHTGRRRPLEANQVSREVGQLLDHWLFDRYLCGTCRGAGWRQGALGSIYQLAVYQVHTWHSEPKEWKPQGTVEAADPRAAYLEAKRLHPGLIVHVARVLTEPCSPGELHYV